MAWEQSLEALPFRGGSSHLVTAIFKKLRGSKNALPERSPPAPQEAADLHIEQLFQEMDDVLEELESPNPSQPQPLLADEERAEKMKAQNRQLEALLRDAGRQAAQLEQLERRAAAQSAAVSASRPRSAQPVPAQRVPISTLESSSVASRLGSAIFGEEDFTKRPSWIDDPRFSRNVEKAYFASLWMYMYGGGMDVFVHSVERHSDDAKLREGTLLITPGAPWESFAHHARKKLQEEWQKKGSIERTISGLFE